MGLRLILNRPTGCVLGGLTGLVLEQSHPWYLLDSTEPCIYFFPPCGFNSSYLLVSDKSNSSEKGISAVGYMTGWVENTLLGEALKGSLACHKLTLKNTL